MVDTWVGYLLRMVENMGLMDDTAIIFTSDHGFYFGEHGGRFGKLQFAKKPDGSLYNFGEPNAIWGFSPLYEELALIPLLAYVPGVAAGTYDGLSSVVDVMPTVLDTMGFDVPEWVEGRSLLPKMRDPSLHGRDFTVTTVPFVNPGDAVHSVDDRLRRLSHANITIVTTDEWTLLYSPGDARSELFHLATDPKQERNVIKEYPDEAHAIHRQLIDFMRETRLSEPLLEYRMELQV
jgi:arylsulfatase A-like enzyme